MSYLSYSTPWTDSFQAAKIVPESETEELFQLYARIASVYPRDDSDLVSSAERKAVADAWQSVGVRIQPMTKAAGG